MRRIDPEHRDNAPFLPELGVLSLVGCAVAGFTAGSAFTDHDARTAGPSRWDAGPTWLVLDQDLFILDGRLADASVVATVAAGKVVHGD